MNNGADEPQVVHDMKNQLGVVLGYCELLIEDAGESDARRRDYQEIRKAALNALALLAEVDAALRAGR